MRPSMNSISLAIIAIVMATAALYFAKGVVAPVVTALVLGVVMTPLSELMDKLRIPAAVGALFAVSLALISIFVIVLMLEPYVSKAVAQGPAIRDELRETIAEVRRLLRGLEKISDDMAAAMDTDGVPEGAPSSGDGEEAMPMPTLSDALFYAPAFLGQFLIFSGTLYFFLLARNSVYDWLADNFESLARRNLRNAAKQVSRYVLTISAINFTFGVCVTLVMHLIGMPSPIVWGLLAFLLNFLLYLGPVSLAVMLAVTGIVVFDGAASFLPPAIYLAMNATEAQFVTPTLVGKSLAVNPLLVFLSIVFGLGLWGPVGGIIAIPLLIWTITVCKKADNQVIVAETSARA